MEAYTQVTPWGAGAMLGWSQAELAKAANVSRQTIADFERGAHMPINNNIGSIIAAFQAAGTELFPRMAVEFVFASGSRGVDH